MENKSNMNFIKTENLETRHKLLYEGYTEITEPGSKYYCFLNDGNKLNFDAEENGIVYTNLLCL
jgi:hypothetical protein